MNTSVWLLLVCLISVASAKFPKDVNRCPSGDNTCLAAESTRVLQTSAKGHTGLNLIQIDPLHISTITLKQGSDSPVNIELNFKETDLIGLSAFKIYSIKGFEQGINGEYEIKLKGPVLHLVGPYKISGKVLVLPIQGEGASNMTLVSPDITIKYTGKTATRNGKEYLYTDNTKLSFTVDRLIMKLENLYNGDKLLGDNTNLFLNENWQEIFGELKRSIFDAFGLIIENVLNQVYRKTPFNELFSN